MLDFQMNNKKHMELRSEPLGSIIFIIQEYNLFHDFCFYGLGEQRANNFNRFDVEFNRFSFIICASKVVRFLLYGDYHINFLILLT